MTPLARMSTVRWKGPYRIGKLLDGQADRLVPASKGVYVVTQRRWKDAPTIRARPLYVGGNTSRTSARFRTRIGDLLADLFGFYSSRTEEAKLGLTRRGHHSGGKKLHLWCRKEERDPRDLYIGWATPKRPKAWCGRCEEDAVFLHLGGSVHMGGPLLNKADPSRCSRRSCTSTRKAHAAYRAELRGRTR